MIEVEQDVRASLRKYGESVDVGVSRLDDVVGRAKRRTRRMAGAASMLLVGAVIAIGVIAQSDDAHRAVVPAGDNTVVTQPTDGSNLTTSDKLASLLAVGEKRLMSPSPLVGRSEPAAVWTGEALLIWGGVNYAPSTRETALADGATYNPLANTWTPLPPSPIAGRGYPAAVWTGDEMLVWGGGADGKSMSDGAAYNPTTRAWRTLPPVTLTNTIRPTAIWTGTEMIVLEGINGSNHGAAYNPSTDTWRTIADPPGRSAMPYPQAVWTGDRAIVELDTNDLPILAEYDPGADSWQTMSPPPIPSGARPALVWTGAEVLMLGGRAGPNAAWIPTTGTWRPLSAPTVDLFTNTPVWTGSAALFWNGGETAIAYAPTSDRWTALTGGSLSVRQSPASVWADGIFLTWSGFQNNPEGGSSGAADGLAWRPGLPADVQRANDQMTEPGSCGNAIADQASMVASGPRADGDRLELWITPTSTGDQTIDLRILLPDGTWSGSTGDGCGYNGLQNWAYASTEVADGQVIGVVDIVGRTDPAAKSVRVTFGSEAVVNAVVQADGYFVVSIRDDTTRYSSTPRVEPLNAASDTTQPG